MLNDKNIAELEDRVSVRLSPKRFQHTLGVKNCAVLLGSKLLPDSLTELSAAALLHDISKELSWEDQLRIISDSGFPITDEDISTPRVIHSFTAPYVIKTEFPEYATVQILSAVENHTVGKADMSIFDKIIFLSDYIEENRTFDSCKSVRNFMLKDFSKLSGKDLEKRLNDACILAIEGAEDALIRMNHPINTRMIRAKKSLLENKL